MKKIVINNIRQELILDNQIIYSLVIENQHEYYKLVTSLIGQINDTTEDELFHYSDGVNLLSISTNSEIIYNFFDLTYNYKKINTQITKYIIKQVKNTKTYFDFNELNSQIVLFLEKIKDEIGLPISYKDDFVINDIIKLADFNYNTEERDILTKIVNYINLLINISNIKIIFLIGLKDLLFEDELNILCKEFIHKQINLIFIDSNRKNYILKDEKIIIIDRDLCEF